MDEDALILYGMTSPNVVKVAIMLEELGLDWRGEHVAVFKGEQFAPEFLALNPLGKVPVLVDPQLGRPLAESGAILLWLAEREGRLLPPPSAPAERAATIQWLMIQMASIGPMFGQLNHFQIVSAEAQPYAFGRYRAQAERLYRLLDERLAAREWMAGGAYSIADVATFPWAGYLERHAFAAEDHPNLVEWRERIAARPAVRSAQARIQAEFADPATRTRRAATTEDLDRFFGRTHDMPEADFSAIVKV
jgi:GSH-dependent disulfide-bond oxidoreductase